MDPANTIPVFVYGTLKRGHGNHRELEGATFAGDAVTAERYALHVADLPRVDPANPVSRIHGELYLVSGARLAALDAFEEHPDRYRRARARVLLADGTAHDAWIYFSENPPGPIVPDGRYDGP